MSSLRLRVNGRFTTPDGAGVGAGGGSAAPIAAARNEARKMVKGLTGSSTYLYYDPI
jgi:hypothetical protein